MAFLKLREWRGWKAEVVGGGDAKKVGGDDEASGGDAKKVGELMRTGGGPVRRAVRRLRWCLLS